eukprot:6194575-Pleurochrysis_carterae.AAC.2
MSEQRMPRASEREEGRDGRERALVGLPCSCEAGLLSATLATLRVSHHRRKPTAMARYVVGQSSGSMGEAKATPHILWTRLAATVGAAINKGTSISDASAGTSARLENSRTRGNSAERETGLAVAAAVLLSSACVVFLAICASVRHKASTSTCRGCVSVASAAQSAPGKEAHRGADE